eukprot:5928273-Prymnesium_polylepis.2
MNSDSERAPLRTWRSRRNTQRSFDRSPLLSSFQAALSSALAVRSHPNACTNDRRVGREHSRLRSAAAAGRSARPLCHPASPRL